MFTHAVSPAAVFFGYMSVVCWAFFLMLGTVGFRASLMFVRHIYRCAATAVPDVHMQSRVLELVRADTCLGAAGMTPHCA